jgi:hypothetical protein
MNIGGKPQTGESIYAGGLIYAKYDGKWSAGTTTKEMKEIAEKNRQNNKTTCRYLKDEPVNGEMAAVYSVHDVSPRSASDSTTWISGSIAESMGRIGGSSGEFPGEWVGVNPCGPDGLRAL